MSETVLKNKTHQDKDIVVGARLGPPFVITPTVVYESKNFEKGASHPWVRAFIARTEGFSVPDAAAAKASSYPSSTPAVLPAKAELKHYLLAGASGSGKTRLALHILRQQMAQGCSVVCVDPKLDTIEALAAAAREAGIPATEVRLVLPQLGAKGAPGWNLLDAKGLPVAQSAADFVSIIAELSTSWGPRLADVLQSALVIVGEHGLSLFEMSRFLMREDYRAALLSREIVAEDPTAFQEARDYFLHEFSDMSRSDRSGAVTPVLTRLRGILSSGFFQALLCPRENTLDLFSLWHKQGAIFVHLDRTSLGDQGAKLLGGLIAHRIYRTAMRSRGPVPVVFSLDELGAQARFVGGALSEIVTVARSQGIRLLAAFQNLEQVEPGLRAALLGSTSARVFFRLSYADARIVAASLSTGAGGGLSRVRIGPPLKEETPQQTWEHPILDPEGHPLHLEPETYKRLSNLLNGVGCDPLLLLDELALQSGIDRLYVRAADTGDAVALTDYLKTLSRSYYRILGPSLRLEVSFTPPRVSGVERFSDTDLMQRWIRAIQDLKTQHAVFNEVGSPPEVIRVADVTLPAPGGAQDKAYWDAAIQAGIPKGDDGASIGEWRTSGIERVLRGEEPIAKATRAATAKKPASEGEAVVTGETRVNRGQSVRGVNDDGSLD